jgi:hypothetical protein
LAGGKSFVIISHKQTTACLQRGKLRNFLPLTKPSPLQTTTKEAQRWPHDNDQQPPVMKEARDAYASRVHGMCFLFLFLFVALLMLSTTTVN